MNIATVTLNPAIDQTVRVANFQRDTVNRAQEMRLDAGGKGVNVASFLAGYGCPVAVTGFLGEENSEIFERLFARKGIEDRFIRIPGQTRIGVKIVDEVNQQTTDINLPGQALPSEALDMLFRTVEELSASYDWFVLAGTLPPGVPTSIYATLINQLKSQGKHVVLDASHEALREGVRAGPTIVKPNRFELQELVGYSLHDEGAILQAATELLKTGMQIVAVSSGPQGALFVDSEMALLAVPPGVVVKTTVGAGDALVAGIMAGLAQGLNLVETARLATAFSVGAITRLGPDLPAPATLRTLCSEVTVQHLSRAKRVL
jgi:1-phosphofructokinase